MASKANAEKKNTVKLKTNGKIFDGWISGSVTKSIQAVAGSFDLTYVDKWVGQDERWQIKEGDECVLVYNDTPVITGYVEKLGVKYDATSRTLSLSGRDKTGDLVDSSTQQSAKSFKGVSLAEMANKLCAPFGIKVIAKSSAANTIIEKASTQVGGTAWETIDKLARYQGVLVYPDGQGAIIFADVAKDVSYSITEGANLLAIDVQTDCGQKYQKYVVAISVGGADNKHRVEVAEVNDSSVRRPRIKEVTINKQGTKADALARAKWELAQATAKSFKLTITAKLWGEVTPYEINSLIKVNAPNAGISGIFLLGSVKFSIDSAGGLKTDLSLVLKDAYNPQPDRIAESVGALSEA